MTPKQKTIILLFIAMLLISACDSRRNQILSSLLTSPTATETPLPPTETPAPTATPTPTMTPTPYMKVESLDLLVYGDYDLADHDLKAIISSSRDPEEVLQAQVDLMELAYLRGDYNGCRDMMTDVSSAFEAVGSFTNPLRAKAWYIYAQCSDELDDHAAVIESLDKYIAYRPDSPIFAETYISIAYAYRDMDDQEMFRKYIDRAELQDPGTVNAYLRLDYAVSFQDQGNHDEAIRLLTDMYNTSADDNLKAAADYYLGVSYLATSRRDEAIACYQDGVNSYPKSYYSYKMLLWLLDNNQAVSDYQRGLINYYIGQYSLANDAFRRYIKNEPGNDGSSWYYIGVCQMNLAEYESAVEAFTKLIEEYPQNRFYVSAWDELAFVQWAYQEKYKAGAETLTGYVSRHPDQPDAPAFLYEAGRILERGNYLTEAAKTWGRLIDEYPLYENSKSALFLAAVSTYRTGDYETSLAYLNRLLLVSGIPEDQAQACFWIAKNYQKKNDPSNAKRYFERAAEQSRTGYYSLRASEILAGKEYMASGDQVLLKVDLDSERQIASQWMTLTFQLDPQSLDDRSAYNTHGAYLKGLEYYTLGSYQKAAAWFDEERETLTGDPAASFSFLDEMIERHIYDAAAYTSRQILTAAGLYEDDRTLDAPNYFNHIRFGTWYAKYVTESCTYYDLPPLILYATMKQESMFSPWASSSAGAIGLMQIMPETGAELAKNLHWPPNYTDADLERVPVAVNFSVSYLMRVYYYFNQSYAAMLSAYNGGAGNTQIWLNQADNDPDLLFEVIRYPETRNYIYNVYRNAHIYEWLYGK